MKPKTSPDQGMSLSFSSFFPIGVPLGTYENNSIFIAAFYLNSFR